MLSRKGTILERSDAMQVTDIRPIKSALREKYKRMRKEMPLQLKEKKDRQIAERICKLWQYRQNSILLTYVSTPIEVDTRALISRALQDGKRVAVPHCVSNTRTMEFYFIDSLEDLEPGSFGVLEPAPDPQKKLTDFSQGLCLVPAFSYDWDGFRLGYGKGYYDRFLSRFQGNMVGICYSECVRPHLPHGRYDRAVELLVTDAFLRRIPQIKKRGEHIGR